MKLVRQIARYFTCYAFLIVWIVGCSKPAPSIERDPFNASGPPPTPPHWVSELPEQPEWWSDVPVNYKAGMGNSNMLQQFHELDAAPEEMVLKGEAPIKERRRLIKFLSLYRSSLPRNSSGEIDLTGCEIAETYEELGDYKMAVKEFSKLVSDYPGDARLYSLAFNYERLGEMQSALQIYQFMAESFETNSTGAEIGRSGIACLTGIKNRFPLIKPGWWSEYQDSPDWLTEVPVTLPAFSCYRDGRDFIIHSFSVKSDPRQAVKAWDLLSGYKPMTHIDQILTDLSISTAYSEAGDHHRAIEWAWQILDHFPGDSTHTTTALRRIAFEYEKLGETNGAAEIFSRWPEAELKYQQTK
jgi:tetratricopeptide (TPR) repeat protein